MRVAFALAVLLVCPATTNRAEAQSGWAAAPRVAPEYQPAGWTSGLQSRVVVPADSYATNVWAQAPDGASPPAAPGSSNSVLPPPAPVTDALAAPAQSAPTESSSKPKPKPPATPEPPKFPVIDVTGFFQLDVAWFDQDATNRLSVGDIPDEIDFRRARLAAKGKVAENFAYMIEFDFAFPGRPNFMDVWVEAQDLPFGNLRIGQFRQAFGMDALTSVRELLFLERSLPFAFVPFRQSGLMAYGSELDDSVTWGVSGYRFPADPFGGSFGDKGYGMSTRLTTALVHIPEENFVLHLGGDYSYNRPSTTLLQYRNTPEVGFNFGVPDTVPFFVDTLPIAANSVSLYNLETAFSYENFMVQAEATTAQIDPLAGSNINLSGVYAQASYVLTGEVHKYNAKTGVYGGITPHHNFGDCGWGAWELAMRYSYLDFNDGPVSGGRLTDFTAGVNWYLNKYVKVQFNYIRAMLDHPVFDDSDANVFAFRTQLQF